MTSSAFALPRAGQAPATTARRQPDDSTPRCVTPSALINNDLDSERRAYQRIRTVRSLTGLPTSTIYRYIKLGQFPAPHRLGPRTVGWLQSDLDQWLASRKTA